MARFRHAAVALATAALLGGCRDVVDVPAAGPGSGKPTAAPRAAVIPPANFVYAQNATFYVNGAPFRHVGANVPELIYQTPLQQERDLDILAAAGVKQVRVFLPNNAYNKWDVIQRLKDTSARAKARWIRLTVALTHNYYQPVWVDEGRWSGSGDLGRHAVPGDEGFYSIDIGGGSKMLNDDWVVWGYNNNYWQFVRDVVWAMRDDWGIFAWDIANETAAVESLRSGARDPWRVDQTVNFFTRVAAEIKSLDPNHMVTTGLITTSWAGMDDAQRRRVYENPNIDYVTVHQYDGAEGEGQRDEMWRANNWFNPRKPVVIEEAGFGMPSWNHLNPGGTFVQAEADAAFSRMKNYFDQYYAGDPAFQVDAIVQWGWGFYGSASTSHSPQNQRKVPEYKALFGRWGGQLDSRLPLIVDNNAYFNDPARARTSQTAAWSSSTYSGERWGNNYQVSTANGGQTGEDGFVFWFNLPAAACKTIDGWWNGNTSRSSAVPYVAYNAAGQHLGTAYANQQINGDRWQQVGSWCFSAGWNRVVLSRWTGASGNIIADAIRVR